MIYQIFGTYPQPYQPYNKRLVEGLKGEHKIQAVSAAKLPISEREKSVLYPDDSKFSLSAFRYALFQKGNSFKAAYRFFKKYGYIIKNKESVFHFHNLQNINDELLDFLIENNIKFVVSLRGYDVTIFPLMSSKNERNLSKILQYSWKVHSVCESLVQNAKEYYQSVEEKSYVIYRTPNLNDVFDFQPKSHLEKQVNIFTISRVHWKKCISESLIAVQKLKRNDIEIKYHIIGGFQGDEKKKLLYLIKKLDLEGEVILHGYKPENEFKNIISKMDLCWIPTINEGLPNTLYFLLKSGIPTVASSTDGIPEVIQNYQNGILFQPYDFDSLAQYTLKLVRDNDLRLKLSENAKHTKLQDLRSEVLQYKEMYDV